MGLWQWILDTCSGGSRRTTRSHEPLCVAEPESGTRPGVTLDSDACTSDHEPATGHEPDTDAWWIGPPDCPGDPVVVDRPDMAAEAHALENLAASHLDGHDVSLPPLPHVPAMVLQRLRRKDWSAAEVADLIGQDQVVAASVLRTVNSPLYRGTERIVNLTPAVTRLGFVGLRTLMMHVSVKGAVFHAAGAMRHLADLLWRRSLACASVMRMLSRFTSVDEDNAYLVGLLHDIGNVMVLRLVRDHHRISGYAPDLPTFEYVCFECHQEFGELVADAWKLPDALSGLISDHHRHPGTEDPLAPERMQLQLADAILSRLGYGPDVERGILDMQVAADLGLAVSPDFRDLLPRLPQELEVMVLADC